MWKVKCEWYRPWNNNSISSANRYSSPPTYEALERSISGYKKDVQSKFHTVLKTAVLANTLYQQGMSGCWFFPSQATFYKDGTYVWREWGGLCLFHLSEPRRIFPLGLKCLITNVPTTVLLFFLPHLHQRTLHLMPWNSSLFCISVCTVTYFCSHHSLILVSIESTS